jgi:hypothetical protein
MKERLSYSGKGAKGHIWKRRDYDKRMIDIFGHDSGDHNGPICTVCGYSFCHHCHKTPPESCPGIKEAVKTGKHSKGRSTLNKRVMPLVSKASKRKTA